MKIYVSEKNSMNVYQFMELCGLDCKYRANIKISHKIMMRKLELRKKSFDNIIVPQRAAFTSVNNENILRGKVVIVRDDYDQCFPYYKPNYIDIDDISQDEKDRELIRQKMLEEYYAEKEYEKTHGIIKPGYAKYMLKKAKRQIEEEMKLIEQSKNNSIEDEYSEKLVNKKRIRMYNRRGFGRR